MKFEIGVDKRNRRQPYPLTIGVIPKTRVFSGAARACPELVEGDLACGGLCRAINQNVVPINLQIGRDANLSRARRQLAGEVGGHGARAAGWESQIIDDALPLAVFAEGFRIRRDRFHAGLRCGIHAVRSEVLDFAVHQQP